MNEPNRTHDREMKIEIGDIIKMTEQEFQNVVDLFKMLADADRKIMMEAVNGSKTRLGKLGAEKFKDYIGKDIFIAIAVKEELQTKQWDFYYKLEKVKLLGVNRKTKELRIETTRKENVEIEPRDIFIEVL